MAALNAICTVLLKSCPLGEGWLRKVQGRFYGLKTVTGRRVKYAIPLNAMDALEDISPFPLH